MEFVLERRRVGGADVLYIHWLTLRNPHAHFSAVRPQLPGQEVPGLGLAREIGELLALMARRLELAAVVFRPAYFHTAYPGRHSFRFLDPARQGRFEALVRDLAPLSLRESAQALAEGRVLLDGAPYVWEPDDMAFWLKPDAVPDAPLVALERERARFTVIPAPGG
jgi:hypothetical protein